MNNFKHFCLSDDLARSLDKMGYNTPTPIQMQAIPLALQGRDILGSAQTGTGKTAAFAIPLVETLLRAPHESALVLTPTRELARQVLKEITQLLGHQSPINTAFLIGGESMDKQLSHLRGKPRVIVGTPGRIIDHLERGSLKLDRTGFLVLDETDRMLDMGFEQQLTKIFKYMPQNRQTLMFSATLPKAIVKLANDYMRNPERVAVGETNVVAVNIAQEVVRIEQDKKYDELMNQLYDRSGSILVFIKTKYGAEKMAKKLRRDGFDTDALHGGLRQNRRTKVMTNFRAKKFRVLIATDVAARGLDVPHIRHVINYDLPQVAEDYIHRMGRTARAGESGSALSFVSQQDGRKWHAIECLLDPDKKQDQGPRSGSRANKGNKFNKNKKRRRSKSGKGQSFSKRPGQGTRPANGASKRSENRYRKSA